MSCSRVGFQESTSTGMTRIVRSTGSRATSTKGTPLGASPKGIGGGVTVAGWGLPATSWSYPWSPSSPWWPMYSICDGTVDVLLPYLHVMTWRLDIDVCARFGTLATGDTTWYYLCWILSSVCNVYAWYNIWLMLTFIVSKNISKYTYNYLYLPIPEYTSNRNSRKKNCT